MPRPRVLVIDDQQDQLQIVSTSLGRDYEVFAASDGLEGYAIACVEQPAVVILDILMPMVDGWTVLRKLRSNPRTKDARIIVSTALDVDAVNDGGRGLRADAVLGKPVDLKKLVLMVRQLSR